MFQYTYDSRGILYSTVFIEVPGFGVQVPANGIELDQQLTHKEGFVWVLQEGQPVQLEDNRGNYYSTDTGESVEFKELGELPSNLTTIAPTSPYDKWDGSKWIKDEIAEQSALRDAALIQRDELLAQATEKIAPLQDAVDLEEATEQETALLKEWKKYRIALNRIESQSGFPKEIDWPTAPNT